MGVAYHGLGYRDIVINKNGKIKSKGRVSDKMALEDGMSLSLIPIGNEYVWVVYESYLPHRPYKSGYIVGRLQTVHIYDKNYKKIMTLPDNVRALYGTGENLIVKIMYANPQKYLITSLRELIESGTKIDEKIIIPEERNSSKHDLFVTKGLIFSSSNSMDTHNRMFEESHQSNHTLFVTKDLVFSSYDGINIYNRSSGDLIKTINSKHLNYPEYFVEADKILYLVGSQGYGISAINLETLEYRKIMDGDHECGIAVINNEIILMHKGRLVGSAKEIMNKNETMLMYKGGLRYKDVW
jgi:hypothetical protein